MGQYSEKPSFWTTDFWEVNSDRSPSFIGNEPLSVWVQPGSDSFESGFVGPFGGFWARSQQALGDGLEECMSNLERVAFEKQCKLLRVRLPPVNSGLTHVIDSVETLEPFGWRKVGVDIDHIVDVSEGLPDFRRGRTRDLAGGMSEGFISETSGSFVEDAITVISRNRRAKDVPLTMNQAMATNLASKFGDAIRVSVVRSGKSKKVVAGSLSIMLQPSVAYVVQWGHEPGEVRGVSPMATLAREVFTDLRNCGAATILLGSSSENGVLNPGLARFKESLGATPTEKWTAEKLLP